MTIATHPTFDGGTPISCALPAAQLVAGRDVVATSCTSQVSTVRPGDVFVVCQEDGQAAEVARKAAEQGAVAVVAEQYLPVFGVTQYQVEDAQEAYSHLCHAMLGSPACDLNPIGIAGTHGKTSIAMLLDSILNIAGKSIATATNQFTRVDGQTSRLVLPTTAPAIADLMDEAAASGCRYASVELDPRTLATKAAHAVEFDVTCLANLHAEYTEDCSPAAHRQRIASALELLSPQGMAVLNADDPYSMQVLGEYDGPALTFGLAETADITATLLEQHVNEQTFLLVIGDESAAVRTKVVGESHVQNCLAAATIAKVYGVSLTDIVRGIQRVTVVPGVMHRFDAGLGLSVFVDRGSTAVARSNALTAARQVTCGNVIAVVDRECSVTGALADRVIETSKRRDQSVVTDAVAKVLAALEVADVDRLRIITQKLSGIAEALLVAKEGDVVVVSGLEARVPTERRATVAMNEAQLLQSLMYEIASEQKKAA